MKSDEEDARDRITADKLFERVIALETTVLVQLSALTTKVEQLNKLAEKFVNQDQFYPVKTIVYGIAMMVGAGIVSGLLTLVIRR